ERFSPVKITMSSQEWCGHVYDGVWPGAGSLMHEGMSYFAEEGEVRQPVTVPDGTLYEDALLIQLRELDGPFLGGVAEWRGHVVPSLWRLRRTHRAVEALDATLTRTDVPAAVSPPVARYTLRYADGFTRAFDVERGGQRRILGWTTSDGET